jgi:hypothetical protein
MHGINEKRERRVAQLSEMGEQVQKCCHRQDTLPRNGRLAPYYYRWQGSRLASGGQNLCATQGALIGTAFGRPDRLSAAARPVPPITEASLGNISACDVAVLRVSYTGKTWANRRR